MPEPIANRDTISISKTVAVFALLAAIATPIATGAVMHYRVGEAERRIEKLEVIVDTQTQLLVRIDENVKQLKSLGWK